MPESSSAAPANAVANVGDRRAHGGARGLTLAARRHRSGVGDRRLLDLLGRGGAQRRIVGGERARAADIGV